MANWFAPRRHCRLNRTGWTAADIGPSFLQESFGRAVMLESGERIERGSEILDVETEKIVNAVESPASGLLRRIIADAGDTLAVGARFPGRAVESPRLARLETERGADRG